MKSVDIPAETAKPFLCVGGWRHITPPSLGVRSITIVGWGVGVLWDIWEIGQSPTTSGIIQSK